MKPSQTESHSQTNIVSNGANVEFDKQNTETDDVPQGGDTVEDSYATNDREVPEVENELPLEQPDDAQNRTPTRR
jgi:hypothetical protein